MSFRHNVIANYLGQGFTAVMGVAFVPLYIKYLGLEAYGLIGVFLVLQAWLSVLDMGMTPMLNREMARLTAGAHTPQSIRNLLYSIELLYLAQVFLVIGAIWLLAPWLATHWISAQKLALDVVASALTIMGVVCALRWFSGLYRGALMGLQAQVWLNGVVALLALLRFGGAALILALFYPTVKAFFLWQAAISLLECAVLMLKVKRLLPGAPAPSAFSVQAIRSTWQFARGMVATSILVLILTQIDKLLLSKVLTLEEFGRYTLAATIAGALAIFFSPISAAIYPQFTQLYTQRREAELIAAYHNAAQLLTTLLTPAALMLVFWGEPILGLWTNDLKLAHTVAPILALLAVGTLLNGYMNVPYMLQLASGWTSFAAWTNAVAVVCIVPVILVVVPTYGSMGAASVWVLLNACYFFIGMHFMHKRLMIAQKWRWYLRDILLPAAAVLLVVKGSLIISPEPLTTLKALGYIVMVLIAAYAMALLVNRQMLLSLFKAPKVGVIDTE